MVKRTNDERDADHDREVKVLTEIMLTRTAAEWEIWLQERHVPASRVRTMKEALADPQIASRNVLHKHENAPGVPGSFSVPVAAFKFAHGGAKVDRPPPIFGQHNEEVLMELGYDKDDILRFKAAKAI
jgi:crotonobetainyl-CoA:carnitine CoA-transferase CaiB-like acyl-CoA transferase